MGRCGPKPASGLDAPASGTFPGPSLNHVALEAYRAARAGIRARAWSTICPMPWKTSWIGASPYM